MGTTFVRYLSAIGQQIKNKWNTLKYKIILMFIFVFLLFLSIHVRATMYKWTDTWTEQQWYEHYKQAKIYNITGLKWR